MIENIEIICKPCRKCELLKKRINFIMECIQAKGNIKLKYKFKHNPDVRDAEKYGYNLSQLPLLLINGNVEGVGHIKEEHMVRMKLESIMRGL